MNNGIGITEGGTAEKGRTFSYVASVANLAEYDENLIALVQVRDGIVRKSVGTLCVRADGQSYVLCRCGSRSIMRETGYLVEDAFGFITLISLCDSVDGGSA